MRMEEQLIRLLTEWSGEIPVSITPMSFGHTNQVFAAVFAHRELIIRTNTEPEVLASTGNNLSILARLGLPVPAVLAVDLTKKQVPWAYMILEKIPGQDLRDELAAMSREQMRVLAGQIISFQHQAAKLPEGKGYGWVPIGRPGPYASWSEIIERDYDRHLPHILNDIDQELIGRLASIKEHYEPYFKRVRPICFLDDVTIKNVIAGDRGLRLGLLRRSAVYDRPHPDSRCFRYWSCWHALYRGVVHPMGRRCGPAGRHRFLFNGSRAAVYRLSQEERQRSGAQAPSFLPDR